MTYSLTLRGELGRKLTIEEMDTNFLYLDNKIVTEIGYNSSNPGEPIARYTATSSGNTITWDADTTDGINTQIIQGEGIFGSGAKGTAIFYGDFATPTNGSTFLQIGDVSGAGLTGISGTVLIPGGHSVGFDMNMNNGFSGGYAGTNLQGNIALQVSGNTLTWDFDTTDDITTLLIQGENALGFGVKGTWNAWQDTSTNVSSAVGAGDLTSFGQGPGSSAMISLNTATMDRAIITTQYNSGGTSFEAGNKVVNGTIENNFSQNKLGNTITWNADTTGTVVTKLEQSQDILGFGASLSGSALTWKDSSTQVSGLVGAIDGSAVGLFPGSVIMSTTNALTNASATITTSYDIVGSQSTLIANVGNGTGDTGFEFDATRGIIRFRDTSVESSFEVRTSSVITRYTSDGVTEYQTVLSDGTFTLQNSTSNQYMSIDLESGVYEIGDLDASGNDTKLIINDISNIIEFKTGTFSMNSLPGINATYSTGDGRVVTVTNGIITGLN